MELAGFVVVVWTAAAMLAWAKTQVCGLEVWRWAVKQG